MAAASPASAPAPDPAATRRTAKRARALRHALAEYELPFLRHHARAGRSARSSPDEPSHPARPAEGWLTLGSSSLLCLTMAVVDRRRRAGPRPRRLHRLPAPMAVGGVLVGFIGAEGRLGPLADVPHRGDLRRAHRPARRSGPAHPERSTPIQGLSPFAAAYQASREVAGPGVHRPRRPRAPGDQRVRPLHPGPGAARLGDGRCSRRTPCSGIAGRSTPSSSSGWSSSSTCRSPTTTSSCYLVLFSLASLLPADPLPRPRRAVRVAPSPDRRPGFDLEDLPARRDAVHRGRGRRLAPAHQRRRPRLRSRRVGRAQRGPHRALPVAPAVTCPPAATAARSAPTSTRPGTQHLRAVEPDASARGHDPAGGRREADVLLAGDRPTTSSTSTAGVRARRRRRRSTRPASRSWTGSVDDADPGARRHQLGRRSRSRRTGPGPADPVAADAERRRPAGRGRPRRATARSSATIERDGDGPYTVTALVPIDGNDPGSSTRRILRAAGTDYPAEVESLYLAVARGAIPDGGQAEALLRPARQPRRPSLDAVSTSPNYLQTRFRESGPNAPVPRTTPTCSTCWRRVQGRLVGRVLRAHSSRASASTTPRRWRSSCASRVSRPADRRGVPARASATAHAATSRS